MIHVCGDLQPAVPCPPRRGPSRLVWTALVVAFGALWAMPAFALLATDKVDLRVLVLSANGYEPSYAAWTAALDREGVPYDALVAETAPAITPAQLEVAPGHARYQAVVLATGGLVSCGLTGCASALAPEEWVALDAYQAKYGIRRVTAYAYPSPEFGLNWPFIAANLSGLQGSLTAEGQLAFPSLVGKVLLDTGTYGYQAEPLPPTASTSFTTLVAGRYGPGGTEASLVGVYKRPDGFEELVVTVDGNQYQLHTMLLSHGLVSWATRGVNLGYHRHYLTVHIDDVFLPDDRWDMHANYTFEDDGATNPLIRMTPADVDRAKAWQSQNGLQLDMVFNGGGSVETILDQGSDPLTTKFLANKSYFTWINHTYQHPNLDNLSAAEILYQIKQNFTWANRNKLPVNNTELVTGEHSGLANPNLAIAIAQTSVKWVAADNSKQPEPYAIATSTTIPRHPTNLYYNVGTFAEQLDEYNYLYFENCVNTATTTCFTAPATWEQYVESEAAIMLRHVLTNDPRPHYVHQANIAEDGTLYPVLDTLLARFKAYVKAPIEQPFFRRSGQLLQMAAAWKAATSGQTATVTQAYYQNGYVYLTSSAAVTAPVTGTAAGVIYAGERSGWVSLAAQTPKVLKVLKPF